MPEHPRREVPRGTRDASAQTGRSSSAAAEEVAKQRAPEVEEVAKQRRPEVEEVAKQPSRDPRSTHPDWRDALRERGYRLTPQRELILAAVDDLGHATPDEVLAKVQETASTVNASTVYRTLEVLEELGLVRHAHLSDRSPTYHSTRGHEHFHLVCRVCQGVTSVDAAAAAPFVDALAGLGFTPDLGHLTVFGRCAACEGATS